MADFLAAAVDPAFRPFAVAGAIVAAIAILELCGLLLGLGLFHLVDDLLPIDGPGGDHGVLAWLGIGEVPFMVVLVVILALFSVFGVSLQTTVMAMAGGGLSPAIASALALLAALPGSAWCSRGLASVVPNVESSGVGLDELVGCSGELVQGRACGKRVAEARIEDASGHSHWLRVRAERGESLETGDPVRIVGRCHGVVFIARRLGPAPP